jgi:hypothetical protein
VWRAPGGKDAAADRTGDNKHHKPSPSALDEPAATQGGDVRQTIAAAKPSLSLPAARTNLRRLVVSSMKIRAARIIFPHGACG